MFKYIFVTTAALCAALIASGCQNTSDMATQPSPAAEEPVVSSGDTIVLRVHGMSCPLCATNVDKQLLKVQGVQAVNVNLNTGRVLVTVSPNNRPPMAELERAVTQSGFTLMKEGGDKE